MSERPTCDTCRFWSHDYAGQAHPGECHRHAPVAGLSVRWPETDYTDWCGEHELPEPANCPRCGGDGIYQDDDGCRLCDGTGWAP